MDVFFVRHAKAGSRRRFEGDDRLRPLSRNGRAQANALVEQLLRSDTTRVLTSPYTRCVETVAPLAKKLGLEVELDEAPGRGRGLVERARDHRARDGADRALLAR